MLSLPPTVRVFVAVEPIDMRGSFDALAGAVRRLGLDPVDGHLYLFLNRRRRLAKALWFDGSGWCLLSKWLKAGSFQLPQGVVLALQLSDRDHAVTRSHRADRSIPRDVSVRGRRYQPRRAAVTASEHADESPDVLVDVSIGAAATRVPARGEARRRTSSSARRAPRARW